MRKKLISLLIALAFLSTCLETLNAQSRTNFKENIVLSNGRYHKASGWVHNLSVMGGPNGGLGSFQYTYKIYKIIKPKFAIGGGGGYRELRDLELCGPDCYLTFKFADVFVNTKLYLNDKRLRLYANTKVGYSIPLNKQSYRAHHGNEPRPIIPVRASSGLLVHPGFGIDFASKHRIKFGIRFGAYVQLTRINNGNRSIFAALQNGISVFF